MKQDFIAFLADSLDNDLDRFFIYKNSVCRLYVAFPGNQRKSHINFLWLSRQMNFLVQLHFYTVETHFSESCTSTIKKNVKFLSERKGWFVELRPIVRK